MAIVVELTTSGEECEPSEVLGPTSKVERWESTVKGQCGRGHAPYGLALLYCIISLRPSWPSFTSPVELCMRARKHTDTRDKVMCRITRNCMAVMCSVQIDETPSVGAVRTSDATRSWTGSGLTVRRNAP